MDRWENRYSITFGLVVHAAVLREAGRRLPLLRLPLRAGADSWSREKPTVRKKQQDNKSGAIILLLEGRSNRLRIGRLESLNDDVISELIERENEF